MKNRTYRPKFQNGSMMIEALAAILIFSLGILAMMGLQASAVNMSSDAKYRSDASMLANQLIGQMWTNRTVTLANTQSDQLNGANQLITYFQGGSGTNGALYNNWVNDVKANLPGVAGVAANQPIVTIPTPTAACATCSVSSQVTIKIFWKSPNESIATGSLCGFANHQAAHCFVATAQII